MKNVKPYLRAIVVKEEPAKEGYAFDIPAISKLERLEFHEDVTFFVGENGSGKSTLLEAIAVAMGMGKEGGTRNIHYETADTVSGLHSYLKTIKSYQKPRECFFLRAESLYNIASYLDQLKEEQREFGLGGDPYASYGGKSLHQQSHGESFLKLLTKKFNRNGLYLLDEPEAALSPARLLAALVRIHDLVQQGTQFIIATHSPILLAYPSAKIMMFDENGLREIAYEDTEHYSITRDFLNNYPKRLQQLFSDE